MAAPPFVYTHRVTYAECTLADHVYHSRYLDVLEAARGEFFRHLGLSFRHWQEQDAIFPVVECRLRYKAPARYDDLLRVEVWLMSVEGVRLNFGYRILDPAQKVVLEGETWHTCTNVAGKVRRLPANLRPALQPYVLAGELRSVG